MKTQDFDFDLPKEQIAQQPEKRREHCRLMVMDRSNGFLEHDRFYHLRDYLNTGDTLILNDTRVIPGRLFGSREGKEESIEVLLLRRLREDQWSCLVRPGRKMKVGSVIIFSEDLSGEVVDILEDGRRVISFRYEGIFEEILDRLGMMPLPPYITKKLENPSDYQTVYARVRGSAAAPTAGLHFTKEMLEDLERSGIHIGYLTLHVGIGTFRPVMEERVEDHIMHEEYYDLPEETAALINETKKRGNRVISVGTTSTRTLESIYQKYGDIRADSGFTDIFIYPGYTFRVIDGIITNFHLPKSSLIMMISAFAGRERVLCAYERARDLGYRFFSFGDAMLIVDRRKDDTHL